MQRHQAVAVQRGDGVTRLLLQPVGLFDAEVGQGVVVDRDAAADPAVDIVAAAQPVEFACRVDAFPGGEQPQRDEEADIDGRPARTAVAGPVARQQARKIQAADPFPDEAGLMVGGDEPVDDTGIDTGGTVGVAEADAGIVASGRAGRGGVRDCRVHGKEVQ